jgi:ABC-2 type transport system permease protein
MENTMNPRALLAVFRTGIAKTAEYRTVLLLTSFAAPALNAGIQGFLWSTVYHSSGRTYLGSLSESMMVTYCIVAALCYAFTGISRNVRESSEDIRSGGLNKFLLRPIAHDLYTLAVGLAEKVPIVMMMLVLWAGITFMLPEVMHYGTIGSVATMCFFLICGFLIRFFIGLAISYCAFWLEEVWTFHVLTDISLWFLSGMLVPLSMLPSSVQEMAIYAPFQYMSYIPASVFMGTVPEEMMIRHTIIAITWVGILWGLCRFLWWRGIVRFGAYGG